MPMHSFKYTVITAKISLEYNLQHKGYQEQCRNSVLVIACSEQQKYSRSLSATICNGILNHTWPHK